MKVLSILLLFALIQGLLAKPFGMSDMEEEGEESSVAVKEDEHDNDEDGATSRSNIYNDEEEDDEKPAEPEIKEESESPVRTIVGTIVQKTIRVASGVRLYQNGKVFFQSQAGTYKRARILGMSGGKISMRLQNGKIVVANAKGISRITVDRVPSSCQLYNGAKVLALEGKKYYPGSVTGFYFSIELDGDRVPRWFPTSSIRHFNPGLCATDGRGGRGAVIKNRRILVRDRRGDHWFYAALRGRLPGGKLRYRKQQYPHAKGIVLNTGNRVVPSVYVNPRSVTVGMRVLVDKDGDELNFYPGVVVKVGYLIRYRLPNKRIRKDLMYIEDIRLRPGQPWYIKDRPTKETEETLEEVEKGQKIVLVIDNSGLPSYILKIRKIRGNTYEYIVKIVFKKTRDINRIKKPKTNTVVYVKSTTESFWVPGKLKRLSTKLRRFTVDILPGTRERKGITGRSYRKDPNIIVPDDISQEGNIFSTLRIIAKVPGTKRKEWFPATIVGYLKKKKRYKVIFDIGIVKELTIKQFRVLPQQDESVVEKMIQVLKRKKTIWITITTHRYRGEIINFGKDDEYVLVKVIITKKAPTDCTKLVDTADKYLRSLRTGNRVWAQVGCDYYNGRVEKRLPTLGKRNSYNKLTIRFRLSGKNAVGKVQYGPLKLLIKGRYYWAEISRISRDGKQFTAFLTARSHRIPKGLREKMREIQREMQRRLSQLWKKGKVVWGKIRNKWYHSEGRIKYQRKRKITKVTFKIKREPRMRVGRTITVVVGSTSFAGSIFRTDARNAYLKAFVPPRIIKGVLNGEKVNIEKEIINNNKTPPIVPTLFAWVTNKGFRFKRGFQAGGTAIVESANSGAEYYISRVLKKRNGKLYVKIIYPGVLRSRRYVTVSLADPTRAAANVPLIRKFGVVGLHVLVPAPKTDGRKGRYLKAVISKIIRRRRRILYTVKFDQKFTYLSRRNKLVRTRILSLPGKYLRMLSVQPKIPTLRRVFHHHRRLYSRQYSILIAKGFGRKGGRDFKLGFTSLGGRIRFRGMSRVIRKSNRVIRRRGGSVLQRRYKGVRRVIRRRGRRVIRRRGRRVTKRRGRRVIRRRGRRVIRRRGRRVIRRGGRRVIKRRGKRGGRRGGRRRRKTGLRRKNGGRRRKVKISGGKRRRFPILGKNGAGTRYGRGRGLRIRGRRVTRKRVVRRGRRTRGRRSRTIRARRRRRTKRRQKRRPRPRKVKKWWK